MAAHDNAENPRSEVILYQTEDARTRVEVRLQDGTAWLTQRQMGELFGKDVRTINEHLLNIYAEDELDAGATIRKFRIVQIEGGREVARLVDCYSLEATLAVGYRVRSVRGTQFRQWATERLREYLVKGFTLDDERLKNPRGHGHIDYFDELLERIRDIRASEQRVYLRLREILMLASDYRASDAETQIFYMTVQNKLHFAATGKTAPQLIAERADHTQPNMGIYTWKGAVVRKGDVGVAKNYLVQDEIEELNRIVVMFLDFAEDQARRRQEIFMRDWQVRLDEFLRFNDRAVLGGAGNISRDAADTRAHGEYALFEQRRRAEREAEAEARLPDEMQALEGTVKKMHPESAAKKASPKARGKKRSDA